MRSVSVTGPLYEAFLMKLHTSLNNYNENYFQAITFVCISSTIAIQDLHLRNADVSDLKPPIKFAAGLSAETIVKVPRRWTLCPSMRKGTPDS